MQLLNEVLRFPEESPRMFLFPLLLCALLWSHAVTGRVGQQQQKARLFTERPCSASVLCNSRLEWRSAHTQNSPCTRFESFGLWSTDQTCAWRKALHLSLHSKKTSSNGRLNSLFPLVPRCYMQQVSFMGSQRMSSSAEEVHTFFLTCLHNTICKIQGGVSGMKPTVPDGEKIKTPVSKSCEIWK